MANTPKLKKQLTKAKQIAGSNILILQLAKEVELLMFFIINNRFLNWLWERSLRRYAKGKGIPIPPKISLGDTMKKEVDNAESS